MEKIDDLVAQLAESGSPNQLTVRDVKAWLSDYLASYADEVKRFPDESTRTHWDLMVADHVSASEAPFVCAFFEPGNVTFLAGRDNSEALRLFGESEFPEEPLDVVPAVESRFSVAARVTVAQDELGRWVRGEAGRDSR